MTARAIGNKRCAKHRVPPGLLQCPIQSSGRCIFRTQTSPTGGGALICRSNVKLYRVEQFWRLSQSFRLPSLCLQFKFSRFSRHRALWPKLVSWSCIEKRTRWVVTCAANQRVHHFQDYGVTPQAQGHECRSLPTPMKITTGICDPLRFVFFNICSQSTGTRV